jgi:hypothetical protein
VAEDRVRGQEAAEVGVVEPSVQVVQAGVRVLPLARVLQARVRARRGVLLPERLVRGGVRPVPVGVARRADEPATRSGRPFPSLARRITSHLLRCPSFQTKDEVIVVLVIEPVVAAVAKPVWQPLYEHAAIAILGYCRSRWLFPVVPNVPHPEESTGCLDHANR